MNIKFDFLGLEEFRRKLDEINAKADELLAKHKYVTPELERLIRQVSAIATHIDEKVS